MLDSEEESEQKERKVKQKKNTGSELKEEITTPDSTQVKLDNKEETIVNQEKVLTNNTNSFTKRKALIISIIFVVIVIIGGILIGSALEKKNYDNLPIKVDIQMTSYYGNIDYILYEFGLDFDLVTMGANCFTGVQKSQFKTEKYGILHTEFRYCKSNSTTIFRVYNTESDQKLRDPKPGELASFDKYGYRIKSSNNTL